MTLKEHPLENPQRQLNSLTKRQLSLRVWQFPSHERSNSLPHQPHASFAKFCFGRGVIFLTARAVDFCLNRRQRGRQMMQWHSYTCHASWWGCCLPWKLNEFIHPCVPFKITPIPLLHLTTSSTQLQRKTEMSMHIDRTIPIHRLIAGIQNSS